MSTIRCDFCNSTEYEIVYTPIGTKRNNRVCICKMCGLVFSIHNKLIWYSREPNPSGDADWGNVRFCKGQRFDAVMDELLPYIKKARWILDVGSSRGHFVKWAREQNQDAVIVAIEPDARVADYPIINMKLENMDLPSDYFDFIYCMQTLEHVDSASDILRRIYDCLEPDGTLFLEVPNIEVIDYSLNVEEFFIDKHNFHFSRDVLCSYMEIAGFKLTSVNEDNLNIRIFATKGLPNKLTATTFPATDSHALIDKYAEIMQRNRAKLPAVVEKIKRIMQNQKVAFWGANTVFDLMVKYGGLEPNGIFCLVDKYMWENVESIHGIPVQSPDMLRVYHPDVCVILARHSSNEIVKSARNFNIRNIIKFSDLLESV